MAPPEHPGSRDEEPLRRLPPPAVWEGIAAATGVRSSPDPEALRRSLDEGEDAAGAVVPTLVPPAVLIAPGPGRAAPTAVPGQGSPRRWSTPVLLGSAGLALVVGAGAGAIVAWRAGETPPVVVVSTAQLASLDGGDAPWTGTAEVVNASDAPSGGRRVVVTTSGLPPVEGAAHEVWLLDPSTGGLVSLGALADGRSPQDGYVLPDGVDLARYSQVDVSAEPLDGDTTHSGATELRGPLTSTTA